MSPEEYLAFERASEDKHEYVDGALVARPRSAYEHSLISSNLVGELGNALLSQPAEVLGSDMRIKVTATDSYFYPDVSVVRGRASLEDEKRDVLLNPKAVIEVLSDSTERYDRGDKFRHYRQIESLAEYVLVSQAEPLVEHYERRADGSWSYRALGPGERLRLPSLGCEIEVDRIYLKVFDAAREG